MPPPSVIAIDGPVAAGKTVVGRLLARRLGYRFLDTGLLYRAITLAALREGVDLGKEEEVAALARRVRLEVEGERVVLDGEEVTADLRRPEVEEAVSLVARLPGVRQALLGLQRTLAGGGGVVVVGRDIGTVVLPGADLKVFLTASPPERARRRCRELREMGRPADYQEVLREMERRDRLDSERAVAPLRPAPDALTLDTDGMGVEEVVSAILSRVDR